MATIGFPLDAVREDAESPWIPSYDGREIREVLSVLVGGGTSARPLAGGSGVNPRTPADTVTATAITWTVKAHGGYIDAQTDGEAAGYLYAVNSSGGLPTGAMAAANATNPRIDLISVQVNDPAEGDGSTVPTVGVVYTTGNPAASPAVPVKPARSLVLARIAVPKFGAGSPVVSWVAPPIVAAGSGSKSKTINATGTGAFPGSGFNIAPAIFIPANSFGSGVDCTLTTSAMAMATVSSGGIFALDILLDGSPIASVVEQPRGGDTAVSLTAVVSLLVSGAGSHSVVARVRTEAGTVSLMTSGRTLPFSVKIEPGSAL